MVEGGDSSEGTLFVDREYKKEPNPAESALKRREHVAKHMDGRLTSWEPAIVLSYDFEAQRVDVLLKNHEDAPPIQNVPIAGSGMMTRPLPSIEDVGVADAFVGQLFYPQTDSEAAYDRRSRTSPQSSPKPHTGLGPIFFPQEPKMVEEDLPSFFDASSGPDDHDSVGPDDTCLYAGENGYIAIKSDGTIVIRGNDAFIGSIDESTTNYDSVDTTGTSASDHVKVS